MSSSRRKPSLWQNAAEVVSLLNPFSQRSARKAETNAGRAWAQMKRARTHRRLADTELVADMPLAS